MSDALTRGRRFRTLNVTDDFNREALHTAMDSAPLVHVFEQLEGDLDMSQIVPTDNGRNS